jgi:filamentous hemagglutinin family protein
MKQFLLRFVTMFFVVGASLGHAAVVTDGSFGAAGPLAGPNFIVPSSLGKIAGGNLFHSFSQFGLNHGESATFSGPGSVHNILARVTGGQISSIDGLIRSTIVGANLFLLNPAGVIFGADASIDVSGSFAVTTGQDVKLNDGSRFNATPGPADALLTSAPPVAFGFLTANSGTISIQGSQLTSAAGKTLAFAAGQVQMTNANLNSGGVVIRGGRLTMAHSNVAIAATNPSARADVQMQTSIGLTNHSSIVATATLNFTNLTIANISAPTISIAGFSSIASFGDGAVNAGNLSVTADHLRLTGGGRLDADTIGPGRGGDINVSAHDILIRDGGTETDRGSAISATTADIGSGGNIHLVTDSLTIGAGALIQSSTFGPGAGGSVRVDAASVSITGGTDVDGFQLLTGITADTLGGDGAAGNVQLNISGQLTISGGGQISSDTFGPGAGGDVVVAAQNALIDGAGLPVFTAISTENQNAGFGNPGGNIVLNIRDTLQLLGGGVVTARTVGASAGGMIDVNATRVFISGEGAALLFSGISASSDNATNGGRGGDVRLNLSGSLEIVAGGGISVSTSGPGAGGSVNINAPSISISGMSTSGIASSITATTTAGLNGGPGGNIVITTNSLYGSDGGEITASTAGSGAGGSIDITAHLLSLNNFTIRADTTSPDSFEMPFTVFQLNVLFDLDHTNDQNLDLALVSPNGTFIDLFSGVGGNGQNFRGTILADDATISIADGHAPFTGRFRPLGPLAAFDGQPFEGTWFLVITDFDSSDTVTLNSWSLRVGSMTFTSSNVPVGLPGPGGSANNISILDIGHIPGTIVPITPGRGGDVRLHADTINLTGGARISAESVFPGAGGRGGDIFISGQDLSITGTQGIETGISARSLGGGASGSVQLSLGTLTLDSFGFIGSSNTGSGDAGSVFVRVDNRLVLRHGSIITTSAAQADAGVIDIESGGSIQLHDSSITSSAGTNGGSVSIRASDMVYLVDSSITATAGTQQTTGAAGGVGGNIFIDPTFIILDNSLISANAAIGRGGNIDLVSSFFLDSESTITATGTQAGTINIAAPELDLSSALVALPSSLLSAETQLRERCTAQLRGDFSSFISLGRGGTEPAPNELKVEF